ncbi:MAG: hypothetical protein J0L93_02410 [Deltaproteobacteria bacterium]|nr:hypothetical protein [Deltaproteobacteria bacterium]
MDQGPRDTSIVEGNLQHFFGSLLIAAAENQRANISPHALDYLTKLLVYFQETAQLFNQKDVRIPVLADMLSEALDADLYRRITLLRQMGDTSLMVSGYFPESLSRRSVDLAYYQKMGGIAYYHLGSLSEEESIYNELSERFIKLSEILNEVSEQTQSKDYSISKLLEFYSQTGSDRIFEKLKKQGVIPFKSPKKDRIL